MKRQTSKDSSASKLHRVKSDSDIQRPSASTRQPMKPKPTNYAVARAKSPPVEDKKQLQPKPNNTNIVKRAKSPIVNDEDRKHMYFRTAKPLNKPAEQK